MRTVEYRIWCPEASPIRVEFPDRLMRGLGFVDSSGVLSGSKQGRVIRIVARGASAENEQQEKVGVFVSRIRGEVFLTEADLAFFNEQQGQIALVVAGHRAGFFVREADGSIQTVRSHEEFCIAPPPIPPLAPKKLLSAAMRTWGWRRKWKWGQAGLAMLAALPIAALAVLPHHGTKAPSALEVHETGGQLRISWKPGRNAVLAIEDGGSRVAIPVYANQSNVTYAQVGSEVTVTLMTVDGTHQPLLERALYISAAKR
jgi:hypothetical protein